MRARRYTLAALAALICLWAAAAAHAGDRVYWTDDADATISFAGLNGSGGGNLTISGTTVVGPQGVVIDAAAGKLYWVDYDGNKISGANLDGSGGHDLSTGAAPVDSPYGIALDPAAGRLYWANAPGTPNAPISFFDLSGATAGQVNTSGATALTNPLGVAVDPTAGRIYWANYNANKISFANLDGSGGGDLTTGAATVNYPTGVAIDSASGRIYWANNGAGTISFANLDGSGGGDLTITGTAVSDPAGVAIDPAAGRIYWANDGPTKGISFAGLNGGAGTTLNTLGAAQTDASFPALFEAPSGAGAPAITAAGKTLSCSPGSWAPDLPQSFLFRAAQSLAYQWSKDGSDIAGANTGTLGISSAASSYGCRVTANNDAGSASQSSEPFAQIKLGKLKRNKRKGTAKLAVTVPSAGTLVLSGKGVAKRTAKAAGTVKLAVKAKGKARRKLNRRGKLKLSFTVAFTPDSGTSSPQSKKVRLVKQG